jgi:molecular chaperone Hsp33
MTQLADDDVLHRFVLERSGVRGVLVDLDATWRTIRARAEYPAALAALLGETLAAAALFTGHTKIDGRLAIQLKGTRALRTVFAECTHQGTLRGLAHWRDPMPTTLTPRDFGAGAMLAVTIETLAPGMREPTRYQGLVDLDADSLAQAFENYFLQSEQLPTRILLATGTDRARGLMLQQLPGSEAEADAWPRAQALFDTLGVDELLGSPNQDLLYRLFHEEQVRVVASRPLAFGCACSRERVAAMLLGLGSDEAHAALQDGVAEVICEFCNQRYAFDRIDVQQLFAGGGSTTPSTTAQ